MRENILIDIYYQSLYNSGMVSKSKIDFEQLRIELRAMTNRYGLYKIVKDELSQRGWWKQKPRGKPNYKIGERK